MSASAELLVIFSVLYFFVIRLVGLCCKPQPLVIIIIINIHRVSEQSRSLLFSTITSANVDQCSWFLTAKFKKKGSAKEDGIKTNTSPQICCRTTLWKVSGQLCSCAAQLIQFTGMKNVFITGVVSLFVYGTQIVFKRVLGLCVVYTRWAKEQCTGALQLCYL